MYKVKVTSSDGHPMTVTWQLDTHRSECLPYVLHAVADAFRVETTERAVEILMGWTKERLVEHLGQLSRQNLLPPSMRHRGR